MDEAWVRYTTIVDGKDVPYWYHTTEIQRFRRPQAPPKNGPAVKSKVLKVRKRDYITTGRAVSLVPMFDVPIPKGNMLPIADVTRTRLPIRKWFTRSVYKIIKEEDSFIDEYSISVPVFIFIWIGSKISWYELIFSLVCTTNR